MPQGVFHLRDLRNLGPYKSCQEERNPKPFSVYRTELLATCMTTIRAASMATPYASMSSAQSSYENTPLGSVPRAWGGRRSRRRSGWLERMREEVSVSLALLRVPYVQYSSLSPRSKPTQEDGKGLLRRNVVVGVLELVEEHGLANPRTWVDKTGPPQVDWDGEERNVCSCTCMRRTKSVSPYSSTGTTTKTTYMSPKGRCSRKA